MTRIANLEQPLFTNEQLEIIVREVMQVIKDYPSLGLLFTGAQALVDQVFLNKKNSINEEQKNK